MLPAGELIECGEEVWVCKMSRKIIQFKSRKDV